MNEAFRNLLENTINAGLYQVIISNARKGNAVMKIKIRPVMLKNEVFFQETAYRGTQVFHENYRDTEVIPRIEDYMLKDFKQCEIEHTNIKAVILSSKKGKLRINKKTSVIKTDGKECSVKASMAHNRVKNYILKEGIPVPFLIDLGVQSESGKIIRAKYDKYKQINRFLEFVEAVLPALRMDREVRIVDFGCGKSYLTFAIYYYLHELMGMDVAITGLDLKADVIERCNELGRKYGYRKLKFMVGNIAEFTEIAEADMVVTLHACDTATDYALEKAIKWNAKVILSVPCCQHEVNGQIACDKLQPLLQYGIIKERMSALITDALRAEMLKAEGYHTDLLEFIDMEHTPKNILIRAVKKAGGKDAWKNAEREDARREAWDKITDVTDFLQIRTTLQDLLGK